MTIREHHDDSERVDDAGWYDDNDVYGDDVERCPFCLQAMERDDAGRLVSCCRAMQEAWEEA